MSTIPIQIIYAVKYPVLVLVPLCLFGSCAFIEKKHVYDNDPLCKEMRRICGEYWDYRKLADGKTSSRLEELKENCNEYSKSCGESMERSELTKPFLDLF